MEDDTKDGMKDVIEEGPVMITKHNWLVIGSIFAMRMEDIASIQLCAIPDTRHPREIFYAPKILHVIKIHTYYPGKIIEITEEDSQKTIGMHAQILIDYMLRTVERFGPK